jgi:hypothetical protein
MESYIEEISYGDEDEFLYEDDDADDSSEFSFAIRLKQLSAWALKKAGSHDRVSPCSRSRARCCAFWIAAIVITMSIHKWTFASESTVRNQVWR